jgi:uncharacterized phiE125 gp8 family phage protein
MIRIILVDSNIENLSVSLAEAKAHLVVDNDLDNDLIERRLKSAIKAIEADTGRKLNSQTWKLTCDTWDEATKVLPFGNLLMVTAVMYTDSDNNTHVVSTDDYGVAGLNTDKGQIVFLSGFSAPASLYEIEPIEIQFHCGYENGKTPENLNDAVLLKLSEIHEDVDTSQAVTSLCEPFRLWDFE